MQVAGMGREKHKKMTGRSAVINVETHFISHQGHIYAESLMDGMFWQKYRNVFDDIYVLVRIKPYEGENLNKWILSDYEGVHFLPLPDYRGPAGYIWHYTQIGRCMKRYLYLYRKISCAVIRSPSPLGYQFLRYWKQTGKPYGMEITTNLSDSYYYSIDWLHSLLYQRLHLQTKKYAKKAKGVSYVTQNVLQEIYPAGGISESYSSIDLPKELFYQRPVLTGKKREYVMIHVSTLALDVKGNEEFLQVHKKLMLDGYCIRSVIVGGGRLLGHYRKRAQELGLSAYTRFTGHISTKEDLMKEMRKADLFLFPTLSEGLPRTVIEAMANSLPCISSDIPSLRELLDEKWLCAPKDIDAFTEKAKILIENIRLYNEAARCNYKMAGNYEYSILNERRSRFYRMLCE